MGEEVKKMKPKYKWLQVRNVWSGELIDGVSWEEEVPDGWYKAFGKEMIEELNDLLEKYNFVDKYQIIQIKEKYAELRWYDNGVPLEMVEEYNEWLKKYEWLSYKTCINCGKPATHMTKGWINPLCDDCDRS